jgi:PAS domain-containing protein
MAMPTTALSVMPPVADDVLRIMVEQWPGAVFVFEADGHLLWCNETARHLTGAETAAAGISWEALKLPWPRPDLGAVAAGAPLDLIHEESNGRWQLRLRTLYPEDSATVVLCLAEPIREERGEPSAHQAPFDAAQAGVWHWNPVADEETIDEPWCRQLQLDPCAGANHAARWAQQIHPDDVAEYRRRRQDVRTGVQSAFEAEYRMLTADHRWVWVLQRGRVVERDADGAPCRVIGLAIDIDRRKREETAVRSSESRLATALWGARAAFWQWHVPTDVRTFSPLWFAISQYTREQWDANTDPWLSRVHTDDCAAVEAALRAYREGGTDALEYEYRLLTGSGDWKWMLDRARAVEWDLEGNATVIMGVSLDIDAQKRSEIALRTSEARLQTAVWGARMGLWDIDFKLDLTRWCDDWCQQYGIDPCEGADHVQRWTQHIHPDDVTEARRRFDAHVAGGQDYYDSEYRIKTREGVWRWIFERGRVTERDEHGAPLRMVGVCLDIDARRQEELRQHFTQPWLENALAEAHGALWLWDVPAGGPVYTDTYYRLLGAEPAVGRADPNFWKQRIHPEDLPKARKHLHSVVQGEAPGFEVEYRLRRDDGSYMWLRDRGRVLARNADGSVRQIVGFSMDITGQRQADEALRRSEQRFRTAALAAGGLVYEVDYATGAVQCFGMEQLLGYDPDEVGQRRDDWMALIHPDDVPPLEAAARHAPKAQCNEMIYRMRHKHGHWLRVLDRRFTLEERNGRPLRRVGFVSALAETN